MKAPVYIIRSIRPVNLLLLAVMYQLLAVKFPELRACLGFDWLLGATLLIAAGGNMENDLFDIHTDQWNRKFNLYHHYEQGFIRLLPYLLYLGGLLAAWQFVRLRGLEVYTLFYFVAVVLLLSLYNRATKKMVLIGNVSISVLVMLSVLQFLIFCRLPIGVQKILVLLGFWAFFANLNRELAKDFQDRRGDRKMRYQTLPIISPRKSIGLIYVNLIALWVVYLTYLQTPHLRPVAKIFFALLLVWGLYVTRKHTTRSFDFVRLAADYKILLALGMAGILMI